ncbi:MAG: cupin domain-containing protein [Leptospirales bacterium]
MQPKQEVIVMGVNSDFNVGLVIKLQDLPWVEDSSLSVRQKILEKDGDNGDSYTAIVRYAPGVRIPSHSHLRGEEIFVMEGALCDEQGRYPAGHYLKFPPGSGHAPFSPEGCILFIKSNQLAGDDSTPVIVDTLNAPWYPGLVSGLSVMTLSSFEARNTALVHWDPGTHFMPHRHYGGEEILVLEGIFEDEHGRYPAGTWTRSPHLSQHRPFTQEGCTILVKTGHLLK